ncbi:MAG TPA: magnesium and cobalt transport protein CorA [Candidatus Limnocylindrales bacterium]|nr:magnesium and cobalt transport protein CorA [Candidatus Limnocylindrales bacterium]
MADRRPRPRFLLPTRRHPAGQPSAVETAPEVSMEARPEDVAAPVEESMVDAGLYVDGRRIESPTTIAETVAKLRSTPRAMAWIGLFRPTDAQFRPVAEEFGLHEVAVEDAIVAHQRPKLERYGDTLFVVLRAASYIDREEEVEFGEIHVFVGPNFVLTVRHSRTPDLAVVRHRMEESQELLALGPESVLYAIFDSVVDGFAPVVAGLDKDIDEIEAQVFRGDPTVSRRIYELSGEVIEFQRSTRPLHGMLEALVAGFEKYDTKQELQRYLRDVADHATTVTERVAGFRQNLSDILTVNATLVNQAQNEEVRRLTEASIEQNEEVKRISAWAAIIFAPTLIGTIYGMNFDMPELHWAFGYPFALALMGVVAVVLWLIFRARGWL